MKIDAWSTEWLRSMIRSMGFVERIEQAVSLNLKHVVAVYAEDWNTSIPNAEVLHSA